jgi:hypothetical protein
MFKRIAVLFSLATMSEPEARGPEEYDNSME